MMLGVEHSSRTRDTAAPADERNCYRDLPSTDRVSSPIEFAQRRCDSSHPMVEQIVCGGRRRTGVFTPCAGHSAWNATVSTSRSLTLDVSLGERSERRLEKAAAVREGLQSTEGHATAHLEGTRVGDWRMLSC